MPVISIIETKNVISAIHLKYGYDFSHYALSSLRYKLDRILEDHHIKFSDILITRLLEDKNFFEEFLYEVSVPSTELFRDSDMWNIFKNEVILKTFSTSSNPLVWFPDTVEGKELYSFLIMAQIEKLIKNFKIVVSSISDKSLSLISGGFFNSKTMDTGLQNFMSVYPGKDMYRFFIKTENGFRFDYSNCGKIEFFKQNFEYIPRPEKSNIIFFRNKFLNYSFESQKPILNTLIKNIQPGGIFILGDKEIISKSDLREHSLVQINSKEKIYYKLH